MSDVCLVLMPYAAVERPSIALGLLKARLQQAKLEPTILYPNIQFAEEIGLDVYAMISENFIETFLGEWTFSGVLFPEFNPNHSEYFDLISPCFKSYENYLPDRNLKEVFLAVREQATAFIESVAQSVANLQPRIIGCSSTFQQHCASLALLKRVRELAPEIITFMGGANCEGAMGLATHKHFPWVDFIISGEGDDLFNEFCYQLLDGGREVDPSILPYGVISPSHRTSTKITISAPRASVQNLDQVPIPDYDDYFQTLHASTLSPYIQPGLLIETSRGCWWGQKHHCTFCGLNGSGINYRSKSPDRVLNEFTQLCERYGLRKFQVVDNILDMNHMNTVIPVLAAGDEAYNIFYETKANLRWEHLQQLAQAGVRCIQPGIESMHNSILKLMNKGNTAWMNVQLLKWARELGIIVFWNILADFPGESDEWYVEMMEWLPLIAHLQPPSGASEIRYDRFSPYYERPTDWGLNLSPLRPYKYVYPLAPEILSELAYFFEDQNNLVTRYAQEGSESTNEKTDRPGLENLKLWVNEWNRLWQSLYYKEHKPEYLPILSMNDSGSLITIYDSRPCATESLLFLEGLAYWVYKVCDRALTYREVVSEINKKLDVPVSWDEIFPIVSELRERKILLDIDGRLLSLAVKGSCSPFLPVSELPAGYIDIHEFRRHNSKSSEKVLLPN